MILRHSFLAENITGHLFLLVVVFSHACYDSLASIRLRKSDFFRSLGSRALQG
jgi:hypothetical protein